MTGRAQWVALIVMNLIKLGGLGIAIDQIFLQPTPRALVLALAAFMMAGAQGVESAVMSFVERFFLLPTKQHPAGDAGQRPGSDK